MTITQGLIEILKLDLPQAVSVYDGPQPRNELQDCICIYGGSSSPVNRHYTGTTQTRSRVWYLVCCSTSIQGSRRIAQAVVDSVDARDLEGNQMVILAVSEPLESREDPSHFSWSVTVEVSHYDN